MANREKTEKQLLEEISNKLDRLTFAISLQGKGDIDKVKLLHQLGYSERDIAYISGVSEKTVNNIKYNHLGKGKAQKVTKNAKKN